MRREMLFFFVVTVFVSVGFCICIWLYLSAVSYIVLERQTRLSDAFFPERWLALVGRYVLSFAFQIKVFCIIVFVL